MIFYGYFLLHFFLHFFLIDFFLRFGGKLNDAWCRAMNLNMGCPLWNGMSAACSNLFGSRTSQKGSFHCQLRVRGKKKVSLGIGWVGHFCYFMTHGDPLFFLSMIEFKEWSWKKRLYFQLHGLKLKKKTWLFERLEPLHDTENCHSLEKLYVWS